MATVIPFPGAGPLPVDRLPLDALLSAIPSLPRPILARLTARMIDRIDELDGDADLEDDLEDSCGAGDDWIGSGPVDVWRAFYRRRPGSDDDAEPDDDDRCVAGDDGCGRVFMRGRWWWGSDTEPEC